VAVIALSPSSDGFTASELANQVRALGQQRASEYSARRAAYDLKKLRGKNLVRRIRKTRRYECLPKGLRAMAALVVLRNKAIQPLLAAAQELRPSRDAQNPRALGKHYDTIRNAMQGVFQELGAGRIKDRQLFFRASPLSALASSRMVSFNSRPGST
jgi:hypothetical protein